MVNDGTGAGKNSTTVPSYKRTKAATGAADTRADGRERERLMRNPGSFDRGKFEGAEYTQRWLCMGSKP